MCYLYILPIFELFVRVRCTSHILREKGPGDDFDSLQIGLVLRGEPSQYSTHITYECLAPFHYL